RSLTGLAIPRGRASPLQSSFDRCIGARAMNAVGLAHGVERTTLDEGLENPTIELSPVDPRREVEEISERPPLFADVEDALEGRAPHPPNGAQTEPNAR